VRLGFGSLVERADAVPLRQQVGLELGRTFLRHLGAFDRATELLTELVSVRVLARCSSGIRLSLKGSRLCQLRVGVPETLIHLFELHACRVQLLLELLGPGIGRVRR
jgi:hypothetical protein